MSASLRMNAKEAAYVFVGNRIFVLEEMFRLGLNIVTIFAVRSSHLERQIGERGIRGEIVATKAELMAALKALDFDVLVSNGCPFLLPVDGYQRSDAVLLNIHPSHLPDLRGKDPVPGALLLKRDSGATCHRIDAGIDTGEIVAQVKIPYSDDLDAGVLYQLSFLAEREAFLEAYARNFAPASAQPAADGLAYFSRRSQDQLINFTADSLDLIVRKITAFGNRSQGVRFVIGGDEYKAFSARELRNSYLLEKAAAFGLNEVVFCYEDVLIVKIAGGVLKLEKVIGPLAKLRPHDRVAAA